MKASTHFIAVSAALLLGASGLLAQSTGTTSGGTTTGTTSTGGTSTGSTSGGTTTGTTSTGTGTSTTDRKGKANPHTPNDHASDRAKEVQAALQKFDAERDAFIAERKALLDKLAAATTEAERKAILEELRAARDDQKATGKEMRDELKKLREQRKGGG